MFELISHTGDIRVRVEAGSLEELFRDALAAMMAYLDPKPDDVDATIRHRTVNVASADRTSLLVDFLNEALALAMIDKQRFSGVRFLSLGEVDLTATLFGTPAAFAEEIKAVTYHEAEVRQSADGSWMTILVFDI